jgi:hypothetical protein
MVMAMDFTNSGNSQLKAAGNEWIKRHGYTFISRIDGNAGQKWGSGKQPASEMENSEGKPVKKKAIKKMLQ